MPRNTASIDAEIASIEARLAASPIASMADGSTSVAYADRGKLEARLDWLYRQRDRLTGAAPLIARGRVVGLAGGPVA